VWTDLHSAGLADKVVWMTGGAFDPSASALMAASGRPVLHKPFTGAELRVQLETTAPAAAQRGSPWR
jgi:hypothetical protein